jgi:hypothetical protein
MADSDALRARRSKRHKAGDHSLCRVDRCPAVVARQPAGAVEAAVSRLLAPLTFGDDDPRAVTAAVALRYARWMDAPRPPASPAALGRSLEAALAHVVESADRSPDFIDGIRADMWARRLAETLAAIRDVASGAQR